MKFITLSLLFLLAARASFAVEIPKDPSSDLTPKTGAQLLGGVDDSRVIAVREYAASRGMALGKSRRFQEIQRLLLKEKPLFADIYRVDHLYLEKGKLRPPIILEARFIATLSNDKQSHETTDAAYEMVAKEEWVTGPLNWIEFLIGEDDTKDNSTIEEILNPRTDEEKKEYNAFYRLAFNEGVNQANIEMLGRIKSLTAFVTGLYTSNALMTRGVLTKPEITTATTPVSGNAFRLNLNSKTQKITGKSQFVLDVNAYKALVNTSNE